MAAFIGFVFFVLDQLLDVLIWLVVANVIISWLTAFQIINLRNPAARNLVALLDRITAPFLWPFRRIIPPIGGIDISPILLIIVVNAVGAKLLPALESWLLGMVGYGAT